MAWREDLSLDHEQGKIKAIGWLASDKPFLSGEVPEKFFERLCRLLQNSWSPGPATAGCHRCELCRFTGGPETSYYKGMQFSGWSSSFLYVPGLDCLYLSPVSVAHYIDAHNYCPPEEFIQAVLNCPPMRSVAYLKAVLDNGGRGLNEPPA